MTSTVRAPFRSEIHLMLLRASATVKDMLTLFIKRAKAEGLLSGVVPHLVDDELSIL